MSKLKEHWQNSYLYKEFQNRKLFKGIRTGDLSKVKDALKKGANINALNEYYPPVVFAIRCKQTDIALELIQQGADLTVMYSNIPTLQYAARYAETKVVDALLTTGLDIETQDKTGGTAIISAAAKGRTDNVELFISKKANVDAVDNLGRSALTFAKAHDHDETSNVLLKANATLDEKQIQTLKDRYKKREQTSDMPFVSPVVM